MASVDPPTVPSITARFCPWCFLLGNVISCGATIGGLDDASLHPFVEKLRHKFPDVLHKIKILTCIHFRVWILSRLLDGFSRRDKDTILMTKICLVESVTNALRTFVRETLILFAVSFLFLTGTIQ
jgi:hypothetical protein